MNILFSVFFNPESIHYYMYTWAMLSHRKRTNNDDYDDDNDNNNKLKKIKNEN